MNRIEPLIESIAGQITADTFHFLYGKRPDQNNVLDEYDFTVKNGIIILDYPLKAQVQKPLATGAKLTLFPLYILFCYKTNIDDEDSVRDVPIQKAWDAAEEFAMRLRKAQGVQSIQLEKYEDVDGLFDLHLSGCALTINPVMWSTTSNCGI
jgi:hypothetical protein